MPVSWYSRSKKEESNILDKPWKGNFECVLETVEIEKKRKIFLARSQKIAYSFEYKVTKIFKSFRESGSSTRKSFSLPENQMQDYLSMSLSQFRCLW